MSRPASYPRIGDYALIGDCHTAALISDRGSVDWCCLPRFDSGSCFGRILDWGRGGYCSIEPAGEDWSSHRAYLDSTLVVVTTFRTPGGQARLIDCFAMRSGGARAPRRQMLRIVEGERGHVDVRLRVMPRFDYGDVRPWLRRENASTWSAIGGNDAVTVWSDVELEVIDDHGLGADGGVRAGERLRLSLTYRHPEDLDGDHADLGHQPEELDGRLDETIDWWREWCSGARLDGPDAPGALRSATVLKALTHAPTGAIAAAPTTSLPEAVGNARNWDYRYSWIRDAAFSVRSLAALGYDAEADGFRRFVERSSAGHAEDLQIMFGVGGERRLVEQELPGLEGYRRSAPVRIGNGAAGQLQLDAYGELVNQSWRWHRRGHSPDDDHWRFLASLIDTAAESWSQPDAGLWEWRGDPQHFVHSKAMCWAALDRGILLADECLRRAPTRRWAKARDEIRAAIDEHGYDGDRNTFVQAFGRPQLDAGLLLLPFFDFVAWDDPRMVGTVDAIRDELGDGNGLLYRYRHDDGLEGEEGAFLACSFWLAECLARQSRGAQAREVFDCVYATANDVGLFSEEYDSGGREMLGNFPQGLTHLAHIAAAIALQEHATHVEE